MSGKRGYGEFPPVLRSPRSELRPFVRLRDFRRFESPFGTDRLILERTRNELFRWNSRLREAETEPREIQSFFVSTNSDLLRRDLGFDGAFRLSGRRHRHPVVWKNQNGQLLPGRRDSTFRYGVRRGKLSRKFDLIGFGPHKGPVFPEPYVSHRGMSVSRKRRRLRVRHSFRLPGSLIGGRRFRNGFETSRERLFERYGHVCLRFVVLRFGIAFVR